MTEAEGIGWGDAHPTADHRTVESREQEATQAWLWSAPDEQVLDPPVSTNAAQLPLGKLTWPNAERLFLRLLERTVSAVQWAKLYGLPGQDQQGIDAYARLASAQQPGDTGTIKRYAVLQSRRVERLSPGDIVSAVEHFLTGEWPPETSTYYYATTYDLRDTRLDAALRQCDEKLAEAGIDFIPWGADEVSELLRFHPRLVDTFFGRGWVEEFCGSDAVEAVAHRLTPQDTHKLRKELTGLYRAVFDSQQAIRPAAGRHDTASVDPGTQGLTDTERFVVLGVTARESTSQDPQGWIGRGGPLGYGPDATGDQNPLAAPDFGRDDHGPALSLFAGGHPENADADRLTTGSTLGHRRRSLRPVSGLLDPASSPATSGSAREPADVWLSQQNRNLLIGAPGSGKSSLLRFVARDLLSAQPQSAVLQRTHGGRLPVWLPFGFLCRHLVASQANSLVTAIRTWLQGRAAEQLWPLVEKALSDDRLLLLVDGIDEWTSPADANIALDAVETFVGRTDAAAFLTSRPYAVDRVPSALNWHAADITVLDDPQRRAIAAQYLTPNDADAAQDAVPPGLVAPDLHARKTVWERANVEPFLAELNSVPELSMLSRTPLFLAMLATSWQGEPLPPKRYELYGAIINLLVERHPQMRRRSSQATGLALETREFKAALQAAAYAIRVDGVVGPIHGSRMRRHLETALADDQVVGYPPDEARRVAEAALRMAEDEVGLLVPQGAGQVGFIHRFVLDHLAGQRLAQLAIAEQVDVFSSRCSDPAWSDTLLAALAAQPNPTLVADILDAVLGSANHTTQVWPQGAATSESSLEFAASALAADVSLTPGKMNEYLDLLVRTIETSSALGHRSTLITSLVQACAHPGSRHRLLPTFRRWLDATRPFPGPALYSLRDLPIDDEFAARLLIRGMRSPSGDVRANAAAAYAQRFGHAREQAEVEVSPEPGEVANSQAMLDRLTDLLRKGPSATSQAAALLAMGEGWPTAAETQQALQWGRLQAKVTVRTTALYLLAMAAPNQRLDDLLHADEMRWVLAQLRDERYLPEHPWTSMNYDLVQRAVAESSPELRSEIAAFVLQTLRTNGRAGGNRELGWWVACKALEDSEPIRDWVVSELRSDNEHALILYNVSLIPDSWRQHPAMRKALSSFVDQKAKHDVHGQAVRLASGLPHDAARAELLKLIDGFRPWAAVNRLVADFGDDQEVRSILLDRLSDDATATAIAPVALDLLGIEAGFNRVYELLESALEPEGRVGNESQVVLADAVALAWQRVREAATADDDGALDDAAVQQARRVLATHSEAAVCRTCMSVSTSGLGWHIAEIINTWPDLAADYAISALRDDRHVMEGINDTIHSVVLRAYAGKPGEAAARALDAALGMLQFLEPELREVLIYELCSSPISPAQLLEVVAPWLSDDDTGVRRMAVVGITQALLRAQSWAEASGSDQIAELGEWRSCVRKQLCAYGMSLEEDRQNAWIAMLLLDDLDLIDGLHETIGEPTEPGVRLTDLVGNPDRLLIDLITQHWAELTKRFGEHVFERLDGARSDRQKAASSSANVLLSLAVGVDNNLAIERLVRGELNKPRPDPPEPGTDATTHPSATVEDDRTRLARVPEVIDWLHRNDADQLRTLKIIAEATDHDSGWGRGMASRRESWGLSRLLDDATPLDRDQLHELLLAPLGDHLWQPAASWMYERGSLRRAVWALRCPADELTQAWLAALKTRFREGRDLLRQPASWLEVAALALGATNAADLPMIMSRMLDPTRVDYLNDAMWQLTSPLLYRLRHDSSAVTALRDSLSGAPWHQENPLFAPDATADGEAEPSPVESSPTLDPTSLLAVGRGVYVAALALARSGKLRSEDVQTCTEMLRRIDPRTIVADPFTLQSGPLWTLGAELLRG